MIEKSMKYCKISNLIYKALGILRLINSILFIITSILIILVKNIKENVANSKTPMDAFAGTLAYIALTIAIIVGIVLLIISLINLALAITGTIAVKKNSIQGLKINGIVKLAVELITILFSILLLIKIIGFGNIKEDISYIGFALISIVINAVLARISYLQISSLNEK